MKPLVSGDNILDLIPQRPPMVMVDAFYGVKENDSFSGLTITENNIFCKDKILYEAGIIEHIAQSAAMRIGFIYKKQNKIIPVGFIVSLDKVHLERLPLCGETLFTKITVLSDFGDFSVIGAEVSSNNRLIAVCNMKIILQNEKT